MTEIEIATKMENHEGRIKELEKKVNGMEDIKDSINKLTNNVDKLYMTVKAVSDKTDETASKINKLEEEPKNEVRDIKKTIITGIVAFLVAYVMAKFF